MQIKSKQLDPVLELPSELPKVIIDEDKLERVLDLIPMPSNSQVADGSSR